MTTYIIACTNLFEAANSRFTARPMTIDIALPYLNGAEVAKGGLTHKTWLSRSRKSVLTLKKSGIEVKFIFEEGIFKLYINSPNLPTAIVTYAKRKLLCTLIRKHIHFVNYHVLAKSNRCGYIIEACRVSQISNKLWLKGYLSINAWHFYSRAKLNMLPTNSRPFISRSGGDATCRRCNSGVESLSHVLQTCRMNMSQITERHNKSLLILTNVLKSKDRILILDAVCPMVDSNVRVDLQVINNRLKTIHLIDMKCPRDDLNLFKLRNEENISKYTELRNSIQVKMPDYSISVHTMIVGSLGTVDPQYLIILKQIGVNKDQILQTVKAMAISNIEESAKIWYTHSTGVPIRYGNHVISEKLAVLRRGIQMEELSIQAGDISQLIVLEDSESEQES